MRKTLIWLRGGLILVASIAACTSAATESANPVVRVETEFQEYAAGDTVELSVTNVSDRPLSYNICIETVLERRTNTEWSPMPRATEQPPCLGAQFGLESAASASGLFVLASDLAAGTYRYRVDALFESDGNTRVPEPQRVSNTFEVRPE